MKHRQIKKIKNKALKLGDAIWINYIDNYLPCNPDLRSLNFDLNYLIKIHKKY